jgi:hypothetical protein
MSWWFVSIASPTIYILFPTMPSTTVFSVRVLCELLFGPSFGPENAKVQRALSHADSELYSTYQISSLYLHRAL